MGAQGRWLREGGFGKGPLGELLTGSQGKALPQGLAEVGMLEAEHVQDMPEALLEVTDGDCRGVLIAAAVVDVVWECREEAEDRFGIGYLSRPSNDVSADCYHLHHK